MTRRALVLGATGFLGRHLVATLLDEGVDVLAGCRTQRSYDELVEWLVRHESPGRPALAVVDFTAPGLGIAEEVRTGITEIYNCAGAYRFGMSEAQARAGNVDTARAVVDVAAGISGLRRVVHVSGYRVDPHSPAEPEWTDDRRASTYRRLGPYEASKVEADSVFRAEAQSRGVPWTVVNPATVSGVAATGESDQYLGLAGTLADLWHGRLAAIPGDDSTFVPVVPVDYVARFMSVLPTDESTAETSYWILDDATPPLPEFVGLVGRHLQVTVPRLRIPVGLVKRLPAALTKADPETVSFLSSDRYPVDPAQEVAARHGIEMPPTVPAILRWADHLAAHRFGEAAVGPLDRGFVDIGGVRTFTARAPEADRTGDDAVVLPGLPVNADTWAAVARSRAGLTVMDLPGLGLSSGDLSDWDRWSDAVAGQAPHLIGHSIGAALAVEAADRAPGAVRRLTLVAPFFLQPVAARRPRRHPLAVAAYLSRIDAPDLSRRLTGSADAAELLRSSVADLRRKPVARNVGRLVRRAEDPRWRAGLVEKLLGFPGQVDIVVGAYDPFDPAAIEALGPLGDRLRIHRIEGAGHHPQLTHPDEVAQAAKDVRVG
ncbi:hypothetical protein GOARA_063_00140 [Gordonia araii NBRC 100433]|uniref:NAD-dependent epimerase/dehydratase family protein n=1 Tax=Gordonia araii NBRC 100433 TaxID=1073574 RepID=G7H4P0_9ACTN|nr:alpha/beta fold hydrolase [Gordonia araii]NNG98043.1 alpha/beta fold hydrolase [Gordonia araii NBRC 100433]GAB10815.1 hypothetical protein GOARA_063_00140 [Gordonia araii NBRC 100433]